MRTRVLGMCLAMGMCLQVLLSPAAAEAPTEAPKGTLLPADQAAGLSEVLAFKTPSGRSGWRVKIPGAVHPDTPAVGDGMVFVGDGPSGKEKVLALDAKTGKPVWAFRAGDNGPMGMLWDDGYLGYTTDSCTLYVHDTRTGKMLWSKWLAGSLKGRPAMAGGLILATYPDNEGVYHLTALHLRTGKVAWDRKIAGEVLFAPVVSGNLVLVACRKGVLHCFHLASGQQIWRRPANVTSAPRVAANRVFIGQWASRTAMLTDTNTKVVRIFEGLNVARLTDAKFLHAGPVAAIHAPHLLSKKVTRIDPPQPVARPRPAKTERTAVIVLNGKRYTQVYRYTPPKPPAPPKVPPPTVVQEHIDWDHGRAPRLCLVGKHCVMVQGETVRSIDPETGKVVWETAIPVSDAPRRPVTPPALAGGKLYLGTTDGRIVCMDANTGRFLWEESVGGEIRCEPAVADGSVYASVADGVVCLRTGDPTADGWRMWGGSPGRNGPMPRGKRVARK